MSGLKTRQQLVIMGLPVLVALLLASLEAITSGNVSEEELLFDAADDPRLELLQKKATKVSSSKVDFGLRDVLALFGVKVSSTSCDNGACASDKATLVTILVILCIALLLVFLAFFFFREDKEEQVTPLCPQLVVRDSPLTFKLALDAAAEKFEVLDNKDPNQIIAKVAMDWPDPFRPCASGIASTARLQNAAGMNLATVVARNVAVSGQALALCRSGCEIFGFVEPDTAMRYHVRHRTGVHLLTLVGDFSTWHVDGVNPAGAVVFSCKQENGFCVGKVQQHVDAGLLICCVLAAHIHRTLQQPSSAVQPIPSPLPSISMSGLTPRNAPQSSPSTPMTARSTQLEDILGQIPQQQEEDNGNDHEVSPACEETSDDGPVEETSEPEIHGGPVAGG